MNYIDLAFALIILVSLVVGYRRGFINGAFGLLALMLSVVAAFALYPYVARYIREYLGEGGSWGLPVAFLSTLAVAGLVISLVLNRFTDLVPADVQTSSANRVLGLVPGFFNGILWSALLATLLLVLPLANRISEMTRGSQVASLLGDQIGKVEDKLAPIWTSRGLTHETGSEEMVRLPFRVSEADAQPDMESAMISKLNKERARQGLTPLIPDTALTRIARQHSRDMLAHSYFSHDTPLGVTPFQRMQAAGIHYSIAGENIALAPTLDIAHSGLMHSPGHRANILRRSFGHVGIGILDGGKFGLMITQDFTE